MLSTVANDVRYALRTLRRNPGFAVAAIAPIALGIGINTGVVSILNNVMFRPLPAPLPNELVTVYQEFQGVQKRRVALALEASFWRLAGTIAGTARSLAGPRWAHWSPCQGVRLPTVPPLPDRSGRASS